MDITLPSSPLNEIGLRLVIFDLDGTLTDTPSSIAWTMNAVLSENGHKAVPVEAIYPLIGLPLAEIFHRLIPPADWSNVPQYMERYLALYREAVVPRTRLYPWVVETLEELDRNGLLLTVATSKKSSTAVQICQVCQIAHHFRLVVGGDTVPRPKPNPDMVLYTLERLGVEPEEALMVGDTTHDIEMGRAAGVLTTAVTYGAQRLEQLATAAPDAVIERFADLRELVLRPR